jgi:hypothetical protein
MKEGSYVKILVNHPSGRNDVFVKEARGQVTDIDCKSCKVHIPFLKNDDDNGSYWFEYKEIEELDYSGLAYEEADVYPDDKVLILGWDIEGIVVEPSENSEPNKFIYIKCKGYPARGWCPSSIKKIKEEVKEEVKEVKEEILQVNSEALIKHLFEVEPSVWELEIDGEIETYFFDDPLSVEVSRDNSMDCNEYLIEICGNKLKLGIDITCDKIHALFTHIVAGQEAIKEKIRVNEINKNIKILVNGE